MSEMLSLVLLCATPRSPAVIPVKTGILALWAMPGVAGLAEIPAFARMTGSNSVSSVDSASVSDANNHDCDVVVLNLCDDAVGSDSVFPESCQVAA